MLCIKKNVGLRLILVSLILALQIGCSSNSKKNNQEATPIITPTIEKSTPLDSLKTFIKLEEINVYNPTIIESLGNRIILFSHDQHSFLIFDSLGIKINQFGRKGRGPGEFETPQKIKSKKNGFSISDYSQLRISNYDMQGNFINLYNYKSEFVFGDLAILKDSVYVTPSGGFKNSLLVKTDLTNNTTSYLGEPITPFQTEKDRNQSVSDFQKGNIPEFLKNSALVEANSQSIYAYLRYFSELLKYNFNGKLMWRIRLTLPANKQILETGIESANRFGRLSAIHYIVNLKAYNDEIYILTYSSIDIPQLLVRIDSDGNLIKSYTFPEIINKSFISDFTVIDSKIYLVDLKSNSIRTATL